LNLPPRTKGEGAQVSKGKGHGGARAAKKKRGRKKSFWSGGGEKPLKPSAKKHGGGWERKENVRRCAGWPADRRKKTASSGESKPSAAIWLILRLEKTKWDMESGQRKVSAKWTRAAEKGRSCPKCCQHAGVMASEEAETKQAIRNDFSMHLFYAPLLLKRWIRRDGDG